MTEQLTYEQHGDRIAWRTVRTMLIQRAPVAAIAALFLSCAEIFDGSSDPGPGSGSVEASRNSGVAPLAVYFTAKPSSTLSAARPFHDLGFVWDFGDAGAGSWAVSGQSRNSDIGPVAAHVFENPGAYTVTCTVTDDLGAQEELRTQITVEDPDVVFSGDRTACFSQAGDFSEAPQGALLITTNRMDTVMSYLATGKRLMLRRGETWSATTSRINVPGPGIFGAFGSGNRPLLNMSENGAAFEFSGPDPQFTDWRLMDIEIDGNTQTAAVGFEAQGMVDRLLVLRVAAHNVQAGASFGHNVVEYLNSNTNFRHGIHRDLFVVDCEIGNSSTNIVYASAKHLVLMGNDFHDLMPNGGQHVARVPYAGGGVIAHNRLAYPQPTKVCLKLHARSWSGSSVIPPGSYTENVVVAYNRLENSVNAWAAAIGPQNESSDERVRNVIVEGNHFIAGPETRTHLVISGQDITVRNNIYDLSGAQSHFCMDVRQRGIEPPPERVYILNNTGWTSEGGSLLLVTISKLSGGLVRNNLLAGSGALTLIGGSAGPESYVADHNLATATPGFLVSTPVARGDYRLSENSVALDSGVTVSALVDANAIARPRDGNNSGTAEFDLGAFER